MRESISGDILPKREVQTNPMHFAAEACWTKAGVGRRIVWSSSMSLAFPSFWPKGVLPEALSSSLARRGSRLRLCWLLPCELVVYEARPLTLLPSRRRIVLVGLAIISLLVSSVVPTSSSSTPSLLVDVFAWRGEICDTGKRTLVFECVLCSRSITAKT